MRYTEAQDPSRVPRPKHSLQTIAAGAAASMLLIPALVMAVAYPVAALGVVGLVLAARPALRALRRSYSARRQREKTRRVCVPKTGVCVEV